MHDSPAGHAVFVGIEINDVGAAGFFRFDDTGAPWLELGVPETVESRIPFGLLTEIDNGSGVIHFSVEADAVDPNIVYVGGDAQPSGDGNQLPNPGADIADVARSPSDWAIAYVIDSNNVYRTTEGDQTWQTITGTLPVTNLQGVAVLPGHPVDRIVVGGVTGVYAASASAPTAWSRFGQDLPHAVVMDLVYDPVDDILVAGTLGRGAWTLRAAAAP